MATKAQRMEEARLWRIDRISALEQALSGLGALASAVEEKFHSIEIPDSSEVPVPIGMLRAARALAK